MNNNEIKMPSQSEDRFMQHDDLSERVRRIQSFLWLEDDEDIMPVARQEINRAIDVMKNVYVKKRLLPFAVVPTRSGGVGLEYKIDEVKAKYRFDADGSMHFSAIKERALLRQTLLARVSQAPAMLDTL